MNWEEIIKFVCVILSGMATALPLVWKLAQYVQAAVKEKNWESLLKLVIKLMCEAEVLFETGKERREYVLDSAMELADIVGYEMDRESMGQLIDALCDMSKLVNPAKIAA